MAPFSFVHVACAGCCGCSSTKSIVMPMYFLLCVLMAAAPVAVPGGQIVALERVIVETAKSERVFDVEVVREERERNRGLMFRRHLERERGMLVATE